MVRGEKLDLTAKKEEGGKKKEWQLRWGGGEVGFSRGESQREGRGEEYEEEERNGRGM